MKKLFAMSAIALAIVGCSEDTLPETEGNSFGQLSVSGTAEVGGTLTAAISDGNGVDESAITYTWMAGDTVISGATSSSFTVTEAQEGTSITVTASYTDNAEYSETLKSNSYSVPLLNTPATFAGDLASKVENTITADVTGAVTVTDVDDGEAAVEAQTDLTTTYGTFSIAADGTWTYTLDGTNSTITSLVDGDDMVTDTISIASADGTTSNIMITITGKAAPTGPVTTQVAKIVDTKDVDTGSDAGELRYKFDSDLAAGKLTVSFLKEDNAIGVEPGKDDAAKDAYITLFGNSTSTKNALVDLRIQADKFVLRGKDDITVPVAFMPDTWTDVEMTWDASAASETVAPMVTVSINGTPVTTAAFSSGSESLSDVATGVKYVAFKFGDDKSKIDGAAYYVDDVKVYSDLAGTTVAFEDDFESYTVGESLDSDDNGDSPYHSNSSEAMVEEVTIGGSSDQTPTEGPGAPDNQVAQISDSMDIDTGSDAGELRYQVASELAEGKLSVSFLKNDNAIGVEPGKDDAAKDAYITLFGNSTSTKNAIVDLRIQADKFVIRGKDDITVPVTFTPDQWTKVEMTWDATAASETVAPMVTVTINGTSITTEAFSSGTESLSDVAAGVKYVAFKLGDDKSKIPNAVYLIDDFKLYSDKAGTTIDFEDDFEGYSVGDSLDVDDNGDSPYHKNSAEAVVAKE